MVARQVGQHRDVERRAIDPSLRQAVRRHFHRARRRALPPVEREALLQVDGVGRGVECGRERAGEAVADGADDGGFAPQLRERLRHPVRHRGLAVGAGDADHVQRARRLAVDVGGDFADAGFQAEHPGVGHIKGGIPLVVIGFPQHAVDALRHRLRDEVAAIARFPGIGGEHRTRHGLAAVVDEFGNVDAEPLQNVRHGFPDRLRCGQAGACVLLGIRHHAPPPARAIAGCAFCVIRVAVSGASGGTAS